MIHIILQNARDNVYLLGVSLDNSCSRILNLYFVDDILLFIEAIENNIKVLQWILISFE
jgi:hypothetical protein